MCNRMGFQGEEVKLPLWKKIVSIPYILLLMLCLLVVACMGAIHEFFECLFYRYGKKQ